VNCLREKRKISTGCNSLDKLVGGGLQPGKITFLYGESATGKTSLAIQCAVNSARMGYKTFFLDSDNGFSVNRLSQISLNDLDSISQLIVIANPSTFQNQINMVDNLDRFLTRKFGLLIIDTITSLYSAEMETGQVFELNKELNRQIATIKNLSITRQISTLIIGQVRNFFKDDNVSIEPIAIRILNYWSDTVISLEPTVRRNVIRAILQPTEEDTNLDCYIILGSKGITDYKKDLPNKKISNYKTFVV